MAIEITEFANVSISVSPTGVAGGNFGILGFLTTDADEALTGKGITSAERARAYTSLASVGGDWSTLSEVYKAANAFYAQTPTPTDFVAMVNFRTAQESVLLGGGSETPAELVANSANWSTDEVGGELLTLTLDGTAVSVDASGISAASPVDHDSIATILSALVNGVVAGATVTHNGYQFVIEGATAGASAGLITAADDTPAARALGLTQASARTIAGIDAETATESLTGVVNTGTEFIGLVTHKLFRDAAFADDSGDSAVDIAVWAEGNKRIYCNTTNDLTTLTNGSTSCVAAKLQSRTLRFSLTTFSRDVNAYPSASVFGRAASVNFSAIGSTITLNLKQMPTIAAENLSPAEFGALRSYNASAVVKIGKTVNAYTDSRMASGSWLDTTHGLLWLENRCEVDMFNLLYVNNTKVGYTQVGVNTTVATLERSLRGAVRNGLCAPGFLPDGTYLPEGFVVTYVPLADVPSSDKGNRTYRGLSFKMVGAGALHEVEVSGEFSE